MKNSYALKPRDNILWVVEYSYCAGDKWYIAAGSECAVAAYKSKDKAKARAKELRSSFEYGSVVKTRVVSYSGDK